MLREGGCSTPGSPSAAGERPVGSRGRPGRDDRRRLATPESVVADGTVAWDLR